MPIRSNAPRTNVVRTSMTIDEQTYRKFQTICVMKDESVLTAINRIIADYVNEWYKPLTREHFSEDCEQIGTEPEKVTEQSNAERARLAKNAYARDYYQTHKAEHKLAMERYWKKIAARMLANGEITPEMIAEEMTRESASK